MAVLRAKDNLTSEQAEDRLEQIYDSAVGAK